MQTFYAFAVFLAVVDYKQFQSFFSAKSVAYEEKKNTKKKVGEKNWWWGASLPELPVARWQQFLSFFFSLFYFVLFFFDSRGGLCRKGGTARNVSQPRLLWSGHATHPMRRWGGGVGGGEWWSLGLIYAWVKLSICAERDSYTNGIFLWLLGENVKSGKDSEDGFVTCLLWFIFFVVWIIVSKNKLNRCKAHCCLLRIHCLVSSRNAHSLLPLRDESEQKLRGRIR